MTLIINMTRLNQQVAVRHTDNKADYVQIVSRGRVTLRDGLVVDPRWLQKNPNIVQVVLDPPSVKEIA